MIVELEIAGLGLTALAVLIKLQQDFTEALVNLNKAIDKVMATVEDCPYCQEKRIKRNGDVKQ